MSINYKTILQISTTAKQTQMGGRKEIEAQQLHNLRRLVEKVRRESPLFAELYEHIPSSDAVQLEKEHSRSGQRSERVEMPLLFLKRLLLRF